ncbi:MAG: hypothetical protein ACR2O8_10030 [Rhizobiaceae bacterium]
MFHFGTKLNDSWTIDGLALFDDFFWGGSGYDKISISSLGNYTFNQNSYWAIHRVEELDFSFIGGSLSVQISDSLLRQAQDDTLTLTFGNTGAINLHAPVTSSGTLFLDGSGTVALSDASPNQVNLKDDIDLVVHGGSQSDTIVAGDGGTLLDGGEGDDQLHAGTGEGADIISFKAGYGRDTVHNFNTAEDAIALQGFDLPDLETLVSHASQQGEDTVIDFGSGDALVLTNVSIDQLAQTTITHDSEPVLPAPIVDDGITTIELGTSAQQLNQLIADAEAGDVLVLADGNHVFDASIIINRDDIALRGSSSDAVTVTFAFAPGSGGNGIVLEGEGDTYASTLPEGVDAGSNLLTLRDGHGFQVGDAIYIQQPNTQDYLDANGWSNVSINEAQYRPFRESIHTIESVEGNAVTLGTDVPYALAAGQGRYYTMDVVSDVSLSGFTVTYDLGQPDSYNFANTHPEFEGTSALLLNNTSNVHVHDVNFTDVASTALNLSSTIGAEIDSVSIQGAHNKGGGGNGYGIELHEAFDNSLTGLDIHDMRHSVVLSAWHAEVNNTVEINSTNRDINLHGSPDQGNVIHVKNAVLDYDFENSGDNWMLVSAGGTNHALTDMSSNTITFDVAVAANRNDIIKGSDAGSILDGGFGYDTLIGGSGDDVLIGGTRRDVMTGGEGSDTFLLKHGDDLDTITDFEFGVSGDAIIFSNNPAVEDFSDLSITESGEDIRVRYGSNSTVILKDTELADVNAANFEFDPLGLISSEDYVTGL